MYLSVVFKFASIVLTFKKYSKNAVWMQTFRFNVILSIIFLSYNFNTIYKSFHKLIWMFQKTFNDKSDLKKGHFIWID